MVLAVEEKPNQEPQYDTALMYLIKKLHILFLETLVAKLHIFKHTRIIVGWWGASYLRSCVTYHLPFLVTIIDWTGEQRALTHCLSIVGMFITCKVFFGISLTQYFILFLNL